jgi:hypothetical protein
MKPLPLREITDVQVLRSLVVELYETKRQIAAIVKSYDTPMTRQLAFKPIQKALARPTKLLEMDGFELRVKITDNDEHSLCHDSVE